MVTQVAAVNTPRLVVLGLCSALGEVGYEVESTNDPQGWAEAHPGHAMLVGVRADDDVNLLNELATGSPSVATVALLDPFSPERLDLCLAAGACGCVSMDWTRDHFVLGLEAGLNGLALLPADMARDFVARKVRRSLPGELTSSQQSWLRRLASGITIHELAGQVGFSERETYRRLRKIYAAMGVRSRTEALMLASSSGLLDDMASDQIEPIHATRSQSHGSLWSQEHVIGP